MIESTPAKKALDELDLLILDLLQKESQLSNADLARRVKLSPPATHARVKRLENEGFINRHVAILDQGMFGFTLICFIFLSTNLHQVEQLEEFEQEIKSMPEVLEFQCLTGEYDYMLKVANRNKDELQKFIRKLNYFTFVGRIQTIVSIREIKHTTILPIV
ncbi:Lrp/AsnC family transcriptional regulator [Lysinibacillus sp. NPDC097214]|uniref:Lrp/AsnC family transcriptional regulator n=1 Tax=Lysinibacillus sp. NPDC097214 TaxID=3390584 RepID=UPI003D092BD0